MVNSDDFRLRALDEHDLIKVLEWRNSERIRASMLSGHIISMEEHRKWFETIRASSQSKYFVFERQTIPIGLLYFTDIDQSRFVCHWGFYLGDEDQPAGTGSALGYLGLENGFEVLGMEKIFGRVLSTNQRSIAFHKKLGFMAEQHGRAQVLKNGTYQDVVSLALSRDDWSKKRDGLSRSIFHCENSSCNP